MRFFPEVLLIIIGVLAAAWCILLCPDGDCDKDEDTEYDHDWIWRKW